MGDRHGPPGRRPGGDSSEEGSGARFRWTWELAVEHEDAAALAAALTPESEEHHELTVEKGRFVARGRGSTGESLHTVDDLLACLTAAVESLEAGGGS